ncbi:surface-associated interspersed protein (SURFIN) [Plasmodium gallinaceum]|uniref:Surface-associated interspersed protein (SURFIN) n=1 Tax=Plasmodium gallinaceum TaxID=5849 RepID=A0A1J1GUW0_PLAGA|nr:surface-associated interspersed protein (SURFIN) [Plasmodium gallinaceum]CRG96027.1 surface-associated interspersed protein (SURFIN) [Plasmodium gallinaceum]
MRKKSILKKARYLSQAEETSCILDEQNGETKENGDNSSEKSKLNTEIKTFVEDSNNELNFYLDDEEISNATEKCQKSSSYVNWRGMDFVNLVLNEETDRNISSLVNCWNKKQSFFETQIRMKTSPTCNLKNFDYCAVLNKNDNCTNPYKDSDLPDLIPLTYSQLNEDQYQSNKTKIIYDRLTKFTNITSDISNYYYKVYEANKSQLNCGKWSMYIHKRGKQFVNMVYNEFYSEESFRKDSTNIWNTYSNRLQNSILSETGNPCNMTSLIYEIKKRENTSDPYGLNWITSDNQENSNGTLYPTTPLPTITQPTAETSDTSHVRNDVDPLDDDAKARIGGYRDSKNVTLNAIASPDDEDKASAAAKATNAVPLEDPSKSHSLTSNNTNGYGSKTDPSILPSPINDTDTHSNTIIRSSENNTTPSPETVTSPETVPSVTPMFSSSTNSSSSEIPAYPIDGSTNSTTNVGSSLLNGTLSTNSHSSPAMDMPESPTPISVQPITVTEINSNRTATFVNESLSYTPHSKPPMEVHIPLNKMELSKNDTMSPSPFKSLAPSHINAAPNNTIESATINNDTQLFGKSYSSSQNELTPIAQPSNLPLIKVHDDTLANCTNICTPNINTTQAPLDEGTEVTPTVKTTGNVLIATVSVGIFILGIVLLLIIIYRCTPIGSWIRNRKSKKKKIRKKIKKISKKPMPSSTNNIEDGPMNSGNHSLLQHEKQILQCEVSFESEGNLKHEQSEKSKERKGIYNEKGNIRICNVTKEGSNKHENEFINEEKLNKDNSKSEIEKMELNVDESRNEIKDELNKNILEENPLHAVGYIGNDTLNEEIENEINLQKEKPTCDFEMKNLGNKRSIKNDVCNWNSWVDIHMTALLECKKEEWKLNKSEFFKICLKEFEKDGENSNLKEMGNNFVIKIKEENSTDTTDKNSSILEKYKNEKWFINLKKEWEQEQKKHLEYLEEHEIKKMREMGVNNFILDKKKKIWKKWIEWQIEHSYEYKNQNWFSELLEEYEKEEIHENLKEEKIEKERNNGIDKNEMKKNLERRILLDIHMMVLEECTKEEWEKEEEFFKANMEEIKIYKNLDEETNILDKIERERSWNVISEKKKEEIEKWKKQKWFIELMLEWKNKEEKYIMEINEEILAKKNQGRVIDIILERQSNIWKKHCENICKKWVEDENNEEWFTKLVNEYENEEKEHESRIYKKSIEKEKENEKTIEREESITEINKLKEGKMRKYEKNNLEESYEMNNLEESYEMSNLEESYEMSNLEESYEMSNLEESYEMNNLEESYEMNNSKINKKKLKWETLIGIYMVILEECRKEEWLLNRGKFLETCLEEFIEEDKEKYPKIIENDLAMIKEGEEDISTLMIEKQKLLWKKWVERNKRMSEKWKNDEWFINLKKEWGKEQEKYDELTNESEIVEIEAGKNPMLEKQKRIWKQWLKKQRKWFILHSEEEWFNNLLDEYEKEEERKEGITKNDAKEEKEIHENIEELKQEADEEIEKNRQKREKLIQNILIEIHMTLLEECMKEELQKEKEYFFKKMVEELRIQENLDEDVNILEIRKKSRNVILNNDKEKIDEWKKKKWFIELILEMKRKEKEYIKEIYDEMIAKKNEEKIRNPMLERQKIIWKKHCEDIHKRWIEKNNKECFTRLIY